MRLRELRAEISVEIQLLALATLGSVCYKNEVSKEAVCFSRAASATRLDVGNKVFRRVSGIAEPPEQDL